ncbi:MAG: hypothetical protein HKO59_16635 [Phycisphaerales bacterium]|nr:hypothetical protein [Phycisphaerae bacterium]NNF42178.1 hypothetical protein [Phycisphaerales bacterium]NNM27577.1 hypothetical protein [Phycisphaerales bacterium]
MTTPPDPDQRPEIPMEDAGDDTPLTPRRAASAEFVVASSVGSEALLREAMDPANQSLAEALRLSFRVLQVVILVLIVLFVFSGFQTVEEGQTGVLLRWGKILRQDGEAALEPGLKFSKWPYPAGEFILFQEKNRRIDLGSTFWPNLQGQSFQQAVNSATIHAQLRPGRDGSILTRDGDIAHIRVDGSYEIESPERFVRCVENDRANPMELDADKLVSLSVQRAAVHLAATRSLQEIVEFAEADKQELRNLAQDLLDAADSGIRLTGTDTPIDPTPPLAIKRAYDELQQAKILAGEQIANARQSADTDLINMAGAQHRKVVALISQYEDAVELDDDDRAEDILVAINAQLESPETVGEVTQILDFARSYQSLVDATLGREAQRFEYLLPSYREQPELLVRRLWLETYSRVLAPETAEIYYVPESGGTFTLALAGQDHIRQARRELLTAKKRFEAFGAAMDPYKYIRRASEYRDGPGRQLRRDSSPIRPGGGTP